MTWTVYRFYDASGALLYAGCTTNLPNRLSWHRTRQPWWGQVVRTDTDTYATAREGKAAEERWLPSGRYNVARTSNVTIPPEEWPWRPWDWDHVPCCPGVWQDAFCLGCRPDPPPFR